MTTLEKLLQVKEMTTQLVFFLDYEYFKEKCKLIAVDLSQQKSLSTDPNVKQHINITGNLEHVSNTPMFFIFKKI